MCDRAGIARQSVQTPVVTVPHPSPRPVQSHVVVELGPGCKRLEEEGPAPHLGGDLVDKVVMDPGVDRVVPACGVDAVRLALNHEANLADVGQRAVRHFDAAVVVQNGHAVAAWVVNVETRPEQKGGGKGVDMQGIGTGAIISTRCGRASSGRGVS